MRPKQTRWAGEGLERLCQGTVAGWITSTRPAGVVESLQRVVRGRGSSRVIPGDHREGDPVAIAQAEDASKVNLSNQLDLVRGIFGFVGLKCQTPVAVGDEDADEEVSNLPCFLMPFRADLRGREVAPIWAGLGPFGQAHIKRAGDGVTTGQCLQPFDDRGVGHAWCPESATRHHDPGHVPTHAIILPVWAKYGQPVLALGCPVGLPICPSERGVRPAVSPTVLSPADGGVSS